MDLENLKNTELYSEELRIDVKKNIDQELFKWFLASILFGTRIQAQIAKKTYKKFEEYELLSPKRILDAGWDFLVYPVMREGGYIRYDGKTSTQLLKNCEKLLEEYDGSLKKIHEEAKNNEDLIDKLTYFHGIGPVTANIFLRELRPVWAKSNPKPTEMVQNIADEFGIDLKKFDRQTWEFVRIEAGLIRHRNDINEK